MSKKEMSIVLLSLLFVALLVTGLVWYGNTHRKAEPDLSKGNMVIDTNATDEERVQQDALANRNVFFAGIEDTTVNKTGAIPLENMEENLDFVLKYIITNADTGEELFATDLIPSGKKVYWTPSEQLEPGVYNIAFTEMPFYPTPDGKDFVPLTQGKNVIKLTVIE